MPLTEDTLPNQRSRVGRRYRGTRPNPQPRYLLHVTVAQTGFLALISFHLLKGYGSNGLLEGAPSSTTSFVDRSTSKVSWYVYSRLYFLASRGLQIGPIHELARGQWQP